MKGISAWMAALVLGMAMISVASEASAGGAPSTVSCSSGGGRRFHCGVHWHDARLVRQESRTACVRGETWDVDSHGIWVDHGCRGVFEEAGAVRDSGYNDRRYREYGRVYDGRDDWRDDAYRRDDYARRDDRGRYDGYAGHDGNRGSWRDPPRPAPRHGRPGGDGRIVSCDSNDKKRVFCRWPIGPGARLVEQTSRSDCREGYSFGFERDGIWASHGCRGKFNIGY